MSRYVRCEECTWSMERDDAHEVVDDHMHLHYYCANHCPLCELADDEIEVGHL